MNCKLNHLHFSKNHSRTEPKCLTERIFWTFNSWRIKIKNNQSSRKENIDSLENRGFEDHQNLIWSSESVEKCIHLNEPADSTLIGKNANPRNKRSQIKVNLSYGRTTILGFIKWVRKYVFKWSQEYISAKFSKNQK